MELKQLRNVVAVVEHGSIGKASEALHVSQPALTKSLQRLEDQLQVKLFDRTSRGMQPTLCGRSLAAHAQSMLAELTRAVAEIEAIKKGANGAVRVGSLIALSPEIISRATTRFMKEFPGVELHVHIDLTSALVRALMAGDFDFIIGVIGSDTVDRRIVYTPIFNDPLVVVMRPGHPLSKNWRISPRDLHTYPWVFPARGGTRRSQLEEMFRAEGLEPPKPQVESTSNDYSKAAVMSGDLLALMPRSAIEMEVSHSLLAVSELDSQVADRSIAIFWRSAEALSPLSRALVEMIKDVCASVRT